MATKVCTKCLIEKDLTDYYKERFGKFGVRSVCKICMKQIYHATIDLEELREKYKFDAEYRERKKLEAKIYAENNKEKVRVYKYAWTKANTGKVRRHKLKHFYNHKEKHKKRSSEYVRTLTNGYIIGIIAQKLKTHRSKIKDLLSPEVIQTQREITKLIRTIKNYGKK